MTPYARLIVAQAKADRWLPILDAVIARALYDVAQLPAESSYDDKKDKKDCRIARALCRTARLQMEVKLCKREIELREGRVS